MFKETKAPIACAVALSLSFVTFGAVAPATASASLSTSASSSTSANFGIHAGATELSDADLDMLIKTLEALPEDLKTANPLTTPNYEQRLNKALSNLDANTGSASLPFPIAKPAVNYLSCAYQIVSTVVQYGIPVAKVISWIKQAKALFGSVKAIWAAIRGGSFTAQLGPEAADIIKALLGMDKVIAACFM